MRGNDVDWYLVRTKPGKERWVRDQLGLILPEVFLLDEWGYAYTENQGEVPAGREELAREAVAECPVHAISITEE